MPTIHLMTGFIGFGKTTVAKELEKQFSAVRLTHDDMMFERYGRSPDDFEKKYKMIDALIREEAAKCINQGKDVILDYGLWTHQKREEYYQFAKTLTDHVIFHVVYCDLDVAKDRALKRTQEDQNTLMINEPTFDILLKQHEPWGDQDDYPVVLHNAPVMQYIGQTVEVKIDRPLKSKHPEFGFEYPLNYGYIPFTKSGDGEELDAYVLMIDEPCREYVGRCIGVIHRFNDDADDKLIVVPEAYDLSDEEIENDVAFQEKWFKHVLIRDKKITKTHFGVYGSIIKDGQILLIKKARGPYTGLYDLPGGSQEKGENDEDTLRREIMEETGCSVIKAENKRSKSVIFSDFTAQSAETGVLEHHAVLYDVQISGEPRKTGDGLDSNGAVWVDIKSLNDKNATPYALIGAGCSLISVANEKDEVIGTHLRGMPLKSNRYPMIAAVLLFNSKGELILQQIALHKKWGGLWTYSAAGHVDAGEDYITAAKRELKEEMGVDADIKKEIAAFPVVRNGHQTAFFHVFVARSDQKIVPDKSEVEAVRKICLNDLQNEIKQNPDQFFDAFLTVVQKYVR